MSNRTLGILILCGFIIAILSFYLYFFVYFTGGLSVTTNQENYKIELYSNSLYKTFYYDCKNKICNVADLSPLDYKLKVIKKDYIDYNQDIIIPKNGILKISVELKKDIKLEKNSTSIIPIESKEQKISRIKNTKINYAYFYLDNLGGFYFKENSDELLDLYYEEKTNNGDLKKIGTFDKVDSSKIRLEKVFGGDYFYLEIGEDKFLYDLKSLDYKKIDLKVEVDYVKQGNESIFLFKTLKGTFVYDYQNETLDYFSLFDDFIFYKDGYIAIVKKDDKIRINNFSLDSTNTKDKIIFWNIETKQKKLIYETEIDIKKLLIVAGKVLFIDDNGEEYSLNIIDI